MMRKAAFIVGSALVASSMARPAHAGTELGVESGPTRSSPIVSSVAAEASFGEDGSRWFGPSLALCLRKGAWCLGAATRFAYASDQWAPSEQRAAHRLSSELLFSASRDFVLGPSRITPSVGLGMGWLHEAPVDETLDADAVGLRSEARVMFSLPVSAEAAASLVLGFGFNPLSWTVSSGGSGADIDPSEPIWLFRSALALSFGL